MPEVSRLVCFFFQAEDGIRDKLVTGVQTCALPIYAYRRNLQRGYIDLLAGKLNGRTPVTDDYRGLIRLELRDLSASIGAASARATDREIGRASCRERGRSWVGAGALQRERSDAQ